MPKHIGSGGPTMKRSVVVEVEVYDRLMQHLGDSPGAFSDYIRRMMRHTVKSLDEKAIKTLPAQTQSILNSILEE